MSSPDRASTLERMRIDDLAQRSGIPSGTIRFYQREGLIAPPEREGRLAYYSEGHLRRLEHVRALQAQGLPLALVGDLLAREEAGEDIGGWLALDAAVFGSAATGEPVGFDELTARLVEGGVAPDAIRATADRIAGGLREVAEAMADAGWESFAADRERISSSEPVAGDVLERFEHLRSLARRIVSTLFTQLLDEAIRSRAEPFAVKTARRRRRSSGRASTRRASGR
jgi:DNA-binding transcriptional MerR regulator